MQDQSARYSAVAITLHWLIAGLLLANIALGVWMHEAIDIAASRGLAVGAYQLHKSLGLSILALVALRLLWRLSHRPPPLPEAISRRQKWLATGVHRCFYLLMLSVPLTGWLFVSTQWRGDIVLNVETVWFDQFNVPHLFNLHRESDSVRQSAAKLFADAHALLAFTMALLIALHIAAAIAHQWHQRDRLLSRMTFALHPNQTGGQRTAHWLGLMTTAGVLLAATYSGSSVFRSTGAEIDMYAAAISSPSGAWQIIPNASAIHFSGEHAGALFNGRFLRWTIDARLNTDDIAASQLAVAIETGSARDGNPLHDRTLPEAEWFDVARFPSAYYRLTRIEPRPPNGYALFGSLQIKDRLIEVAPLSLVLDGDVAQISGDVVLDRASIDMGMQSDPHADWVSAEIIVSIAASLQRPED
ncbi:MAG: cytochrome b/b6 domain-containing protein [Porticoccaceae bacterium]|nr:cytochrome b/b6 domain-containing protein [Porticoccaceae bacterium]